MVVYLIPFPPTRVFVVLYKILLWKISTALENILSFVVFVHACLVMIHLLVIWGVISFWAPENAWRQVMFFVQYLDENKQLILAILDNQNLGKLNECATYVANLSARPVFLLLFFLCVLYEKLGGFIFIFSGQIRQENPHFICRNYVFNYTWLLWGQLYSALVSYGAYQ